MCVALVTVCLCVRHMCAWCLNRASDPPELEWQATMSCHAGAVNGKNSKYEAIPQAHLYPLKYPQRWTPSAAHF